MKNIDVGEDLTSRQCMGLIWLAQAYLGSQRVGPFFGPFNLSLVCSILFFYIHHEDQVLLIGSRRRPSILKE